MRRQAAFWMAVVSLVLAACSPDQKPRASEISSPLAATPVEIGPAASATTTPSPTAPPALESFTGPYANAVALLDGVCFEFLYDMNGETWVWTGPEELTAFYDRADAAKRCPEPVERATFDFSQDALAGAVNVSTGCDAAHRLVDLTRDDSARTEMLALQFQVRAGCAYDLVQPFLIAVPRPPEGYTLRVIVLPP